MPGTPSFDDERFTQFGMLVEGYQQVVRALEDTLKSDCDLSMPWFEVLLRLGRSPEYTLMMSELAAQLGVTSGAVTRLIDRISAAGYVSRQACDEDRRVQWAKLTPAGIAKLEQAAAVHLSDLDREYFGRLSDREVSAVSKAMDELRQPLGTGL